LTFWRFTNRIIIIIIIIIRMSTCLLRSVFLVTSQISTNPFILVKDKNLSSPVLLYYQVVKKHSYGYVENYAGH